MSDLLVKPNGPIRRYRHGHKPAGGISPEYATWNAMKARCNNPQNPNYPRYGGRGIKVCDRWQKDFVAFLEDVGRRPEGATSLDRIDNTGNYEPGNVRWATETEQANNRRSNKFLSFGGERLTHAEWSRRTGISQGLIHVRLKSGWSVEQTLTTPVRGFATKDERSEPVAVKIYERPPV